MDVCKTKFVDVVVKLKESAKGVPSNLLNLVKKYANTTSVNQIFQQADLGEITAVIRVSVPSETSVKSVANTITTSMQGLDNMVDGQLMTEMNAIVVDPEAPAMKDQASGSGMVIPSFMAIAAAVSAVVFI